MGFHLPLPSLPYLDANVLKSIPSQNFWIFVGLIALFSLFFFYQSYKNILKARIIQDTPTAKIRSAAQGYVELKGIQHFHKNALFAPYSTLPCTWYRCTLEQYINNQWTVIEQGMSQQPFELDDGTGICVIIPNGAQITTPTIDRWMGFSRNPGGKPKNWFMRLLGFFGRFRYCEWRMTDGMPLYALGNFHTQVVNNQPINILSQEGLTARYPFILSALDQKKVTRGHQFDAAIWFIAYLAVMAGIAWLILVRIN